MMEEQEFLDNTALLIERHDLIRSSERLLLEHVGFNVITAESSVEGVELFDCYSDVIDIVITDSELDGSAVDLCKRVAAVDSSIPVVLVSSEEHGRLEDGCFAAVIRNPFGTNFLQVISSLVAFRGPKPVSRRASCC